MTNHSAGGVGGGNCTLHSPLPPLPFRDGGSNSAGEGMTESNSATFPPHSSPPPSPMLTQEGVEGEPPRSLLSAAPSRISIALEPLLMGGLLQCPPR